MNIIGDFGNFIVKYQNQIGVFLIILVAILALILVTKFVVNRKNERELLSEINDTVTEIHTVVSSLDGKKSDVIYIDNRISEPKSEGQALLQETDVSAVADILETVGRAKDGQNTQVQQVESQEDLATDVETEVVEVPKKYFSRDCGTAKNGKTYTIEELERQIKE